jgi:NAD(P)-dependent dehydrogenase (short-subunit alcohol dehydrogenase family)
MVRQDAPYKTSLRLDGDDGIDYNNIHSRRFQIQRFLKGKIMARSVVITGSSTGIGRATAMLFANKGWKVAATMRSPERENDLERIKGCKLYSLDVTSLTSIRKAVETILKDFWQVDVVVNNAGYALSGVFEAVTREQIQRQFDTNLFGLMDVTRAFLPHFRSRRTGLFINVSSIGGLTTTPLASLYHATKWAVEGFSEALLYELNPLGIGVKLIEPGRTKTDFSTRSQERVVVADLTDYEDTISRVRTSLAKAWDASKLSPATLVAEAIFQAATDGTNRIRYIVGEDAIERYEHRLQEGDVASVERMRQQLLGK